jgi:hypothetical protein
MAAAPKMFRNLIVIDCSPVSSALQLLPGDHNDHGATRQREFPLTA